MKLQFTAITMLVASFLVGQSIRGFVRDENGLPLEGATIECGNIIETTNQIGEFKLEGKSNAVQLTATYLGYESQTIMLNDTGKEVLFYLKSKNFEISGVNIVAKNNALSHVTKIDLKTKPVFSSQQLLRRVPGLFIAQHAGGGKAEQIFLRGFDIDHGTDISISVDGIPVNMVSHAHGQGYADLHFLIPETVNQIDFGKGPYQTDKGNFATAGYVDFTTKDRPENSFFNLEAGDFNTYRASGIANLINGKSKNNMAYLATEYLYSDGPFISPQGFNRFNIFGKYTHLSDQGDKLSVELSNFSSKWNASGQIPQRLVDNNTISRFGSVDDKEGGFTSRFNANVSSVKRLKRSSLMVSNFYYSKYAFDLYSNFTFFLEDPINGDQIRQKENRNVLGGKTALKSNFNWNDWKIQSSVGLGIRYDDVNNNELSHTLNRSTTLKRKVLGNLNETNQFTFINADFTLNKWTINAGLRGDYFDFKYADQLHANAATESKSIYLLSPKLSAIYQVNKNLQWFIKTGKGFHSNDTRAIVKSNYESTPNGITDILPAAYGSDLGTIFKPYKNLIVNSSFWFLHLDQEFVYVGDGGIVEPSGKTRRYGFDLGLRNEFSPGFFLDWDMNYTIARSIEAMEGENFIPLAPDFTSTGGINYQSNKKWSGGLSYRYIGNRPANENNTITAKGYFVSDAVVAYKIGKVNVSLIGENIFNTQWNEAQFATLTQLQNEPQPVEELHFTPGNPFFIRMSVSYKM